MNPTPHTCPQCGAPLESDRPCPACMLAQAMVAQTGPSPGPGFHPSLEELAALFPQYDLQRPLGRGGMGVVYLARQKSLNRLVALKILDPARARDARFAERFAHEAELLARLSHPHIVTIHDFGEAGGLFYLVMEYVDGVNLRDLLRAGRLDPARALAILPPVCDALQYAHDHGIVHRDIKPENLLLDRAGRVKIADFGIAALAGTDGGRAGTPPYMAPEQDSDGAKVDHRADIFALGAVLYEMLTGERPATDPVPPSRKGSLDARLDEVVMRALQREPGLRYQRADDVRTRIETIAATAPPLPPPDDLPVTPAAVEVAAPAKFSRMAIVGAAWIPLFFLSFFLFLGLFTVRQVVKSPPGSPPMEQSGPPWWVYLALVVMVVGFAAPLVTTTLGWIARSRIRKSGGRLRGEGLALFDGLFFPVLGVIALIVGAWFAKPGVVNPPAPAAPMQTPAKPHFQPVRNIVLADGEMVDFDTGSVSGWSTDAIPEEQIGALFWRTLKASGTPAVENGEDEAAMRILARIQQDGLDAAYQVRNLNHLANLGMTVVPVNADVWDMVSPIRFSNYLDDANEHRRMPAVAQVPDDFGVAHTRSWGGGPPTYIFRTREGAEGLLQVTGFHRDPAGIRLRYKLAQE